MQYWRELGDDTWVHVEACIYDADTPCTEYPEDCCLARKYAEALLDRLQAADDEDPF